jgi:hypothetical protein
VEPESFSEIGPALVLGESPAREGVQEPDANQVLEQQEQGKKENSFT